MTAQRLANIKHNKPKSKIESIKKKVRGVKKKNGKKNESKLHKIGVPAGYVAVTALIVSLICQGVGACD